VREVARDVGRAIQDAMRAIEAANPSRLEGIFGDAAWTNRERLPDATLKNLLEHFSSRTLSVERVPEDELGNAHEFLIKKFADDSGHTAAEFYTNRTVVHLMTQLLDPQPGESIYDPTCGTGGMLLSALAQVRRQGKEHRTLRLYGQERNLMTSAIARMNLLLHGVEDFEIARGDTLAEPKLLNTDRLRKFNVILANPPYSIKQWNRDAFTNDPYGRNSFGTPPQGRADYAFWQHILASLHDRDGRCAILFPHGVLFRREEAEMRRQMIEADVIECIVGLGPHLFYNSGMEASIIICRRAKPVGRRHKILFVDAATEVVHGRAGSFLASEHIDRIAAAYQGFVEERGFSRVVPLDELRRHEGNLSIALYLARDPESPRDRDGGDPGLRTLVGEWVEQTSRAHHALSTVVPNMEWSTPSVSILDRSTVPDMGDEPAWETVRLGCVVHRVAGKAKLEDGEVQRWIGADHIDEANLHVSRFSTTDDPLFPPTFRFTFKAGDILLHSRNPRKVAVPRFDGITGEKLFVLQPKDTARLAPSYLAYVLQSSQFSDWVSRWLTGSVNKFLNWSALERFEFRLPPIEQQRESAEVLESLDESSR
jgi:type I restriction enzyme M protein